MLRKLALFIFLLGAAGCGDDGGSTGPPSIPDITGSFVGSVEMAMTADGATVTLDCSARFDIGSQTGSAWAGVIHFTDSNDLCPETDDVSGTVNADGQVTVTLDHADLAEGCTTFSGSKVFEGVLSGNHLGLSASFTCDGVQITLEFSGTRS